MKTTFIANNKIWTNTFLNIHIYHFIVYLLRIYIPIGSSISSNIRVTRSSTKTTNQGSVKEKRKEISKRRNLRLEFARSHICNGLILFI